MASGIYAQVDLAANTVTTAYGPTIPTLAVYNVNFCNRTATAGTIRIAVSATATPSDSEWLNYGGPPLPANGTVERTGIPIQAGKYIVVWSSIADVSVCVMGVE